MQSNFTIEELRMIDKMVESPEQTKQYETGQPRWRVTGESGAQFLYLYGQSVCWLKDFNHFMSLWNLLNVCPYCKKIIQ